VTVITARSNARVRRWRELGRDARLRRAEKRALIEGEHLVTASLDAGGRVEALLLSESGEERFGALAARAGAATVMADDVFAALADTDSPAGVAAEIVLPVPARKLEDARHCLFLEGVQDAGNVGAILRSAAAFGIGDAVLGPGCADPWSPKVLRGGMGAHFALVVHEAKDLAADMKRFGGRVACTAPRGGVPLAQADLSGRIGWLFGGEGPGVSERLAALADLRVAIPMPGRMESLNVAAAAAVCFYELSRRAARS
jgi:TrmH family RNA methyltransferase